MISVNRVLGPERGFLEGEERLAQRTRLRSLEFCEDTDVPLQTLEPCAGSSREQEKGTSVVS